MSDSPSNLSPDSLLRDFLLSPSDLFQLAEAHKLSLDALIAWWSDPATKACLRALEEIAESRRDLRAKLHATKAIDRLAYLSESTGNQPNERRHAANAILKHAPATRSPRNPRRAPTPDRATGFGDSPTPVKPLLAPSIAPTHTPESSHAAPASHPTYTPNEPYWSHSVQSPLNHEPTTAQGRESEAGELARNSGGSRTRLST